MLRCSWVSRLLLVASGVCACGDEGTGPGTSPPSSLSIEVGNDYFRSVRNGSMEPAFDTVAVNGTIPWTWVQDGEHGVEFQDQSLPVSAVMSRPFPASRPPNGQSRAKATRRHLPLRKTVRRSPLPGRLAALRS